MVKALSEGSVSACVLVVRWTLCLEMWLAIHTTGSFEEDVQLGQTLCFVALQQVCPGEVSGL